jgi:hypothetical protein
MKLPIIYFCFLTIGVVSCLNSEKHEMVEAELSETDTIVTEEIVREKPVAIENGKFLTINNKQFLYGGEDGTQHFDISNCELIDSQFHYGIGREEFPALLAPEFISVNEADKIWHDTTRFLLAYSGNEIKAYSVEDLTRHEVVNDMLNGEPIMAAYCVLADLGAVYTRTYGDKVLTFGLSGYTYHDDDVWGGVDGFVFWDRETESLWWPLIGKSVSGPLKDVVLQELDSAKWVDTNWKNIKENYSTAQILKSGQDYERPTTWQKYTDVSDIVNNFTLED